jgi:quinol monooxygenase YgiN
LIVFSLRILVLESDRRRVITSFEPLIAWTRVQPGCRACHLLTDIEDPRRIVLLEEWDTQEQLDRHLRCEDYRRVLAAIELSQEAPQIHFDTVATRAGIEVVEAARTPRTR